MTNLNTHTPQPPNIQSSSKETTTKAKKLDHQIHLLKEKTRIPFPRPKRGHCSESNPKGSEKSVGGTESVPIVGVEACAEEEGDGEEPRVGVDRD
jgi:hypothetical protein